MSSFVLKIFRGGSRNPDQVEFYDTESPVVSKIDDVEVSHQIEISVGNRSDMVDVYHGDHVFIENAHGTTIHSIR